ncbi:MAG: hypothetical protein P0Y65_05790 [Candidatus Devosia phytovorans]|uniref:Uncharacterized protein n=1 Tax=Candidatus Devosia phytovorans TaxID=3121372 RepID=A0AAJ6B102_9HYPH|nr:hypothetical protein [Devosia sp.]WEK05767.1 MAG: hypothetical protein P0Y65_05790 [Devosia sp.]
MTFDILFYALPIVITAASFAAVAWSQWQTRKMLMTARAQAKALAEQANAKASEATVSENFDQTVVSVKAESK